MLSLATIAVSAMMMLAPAAQEPEMVYIGTYEVTAYNYAEGNGENYETAYRYEPEPYYTVAAKGFNPGTILFVEGVGKVQVQDTGSFPDNVIDLHVGYDDPEAWGRQESLEGEMRANLKRARQNKGMTQQQVADYLGISERQYHYIESGERLGKIKYWDSLEDLFNLYQRTLRDKEDSR